ncbi:homeobox and c2h2 transcription [Stagonosporopsis vannaccii]|nr:homeobox and c2h2 transcription [Stagonosporopsis vannaccii]
MAQFFDFGEAAMPDVHQEPDQDLAAIQTSESQLLDAFLESNNAQAEEFNTDFSSWLPGYQKPANPCDYCRSKSLECFIYNAKGDGTSGCSPCNNLFRPCSFSNPELMPYRTQRTALDTLDVVGENDVHQWGGLTRRKQLRSKGHIGPIDDESGDLGPKKGAAAARFPRAAVKILKDWMVEHHDHPYPTEEEKEMLGQQTGLSSSQISNWMANTRRRQKARPKRSSSPSIRPSTEALNIPPGRTWESLSKYNSTESSQPQTSTSTSGRFFKFRVKDQSQAHPFERWKHSPPENEPAPLTAIAQAVETFDLPEITSASSSYQHLSSNKSTDSFSVFRAPSMSSLETVHTTMSSGSLGSRHTAYSHGSRHSLGSLNSLKSKERRRRRRIPTRAPKDTEKDIPRLFQCTFCTDRFKSKYDWSRHEKSLHLSLEKWICAPLGEVVADAATGQSKCVYCGELEPSKDHLATHNHSACEEKGLESRTFYRKDHLRQHLRLMHDVKMTPAMDSWKSEAQYIKSRCGFCSMEFDKWQDRMDHLSKEFRNGADMKDWKGCRGLDPSVAVHVTNAMPPYLIANESKSPFPFSASNGSSCSRLPVRLGSKDLEYLLPNTTNLSDAYQDGGQTVGPIALQNTTAQDYSSSESPENNTRATCWEILTLRLGRFARHHVEEHGTGTVTDEMLQKEARIILYGEPDDPWHQTAADNPEWLNLFKKAHGIDHSIQVSGVYSQHEIYEDLGLGSTAHLDPSFNVHNVTDFHVLNLAVDDPTRAIQFDCSLAGTTKMYERARHMSSTQSPGASGLTGSTSASPTTTASRRASGLAMAPINEQGCTNLDLTKAMDNFHLPSWDQLPSEFQNPAVSTGFESTIPLDTITSAMDVNGSTSTAPAMTWDEHELSFDMDMDLDFATEMANAGMTQ